MKAWPRLLIRHQSLTFCRLRKDRFSNEVLSKEVLKEGPSERPPGFFRLRNPPIVPINNATNNFTWKKMEKILKIISKYFLVFKIKF